MHKNDVQSVADGDTHSGGSTLGPGGTAPPNLAKPHPQFLDTVVLLLVGLIGSIVNFA